ncbi:RNA polymerase sigma factor [Patescibacteria group bacterium]|nr:RNA polymerase sigma factor [Patescibacteria group bacterium]MBU4512496.1 RNA polymerase sigma factor [Patescibacteria group bacterium]MCG2693525.1 RNA polymerase sigma factor [Candidatus Parcubacteria bacterium]
MRVKFLEKRLIRKVQNGDAEAFAQIYDEYIDKIYKFIYFKVKTPQEAEDLTSQVFTKILEYILSGREIESIQALIYATARNQVVDKYRGKLQEVPLDWAIAKQETISQELEITDDFAKVEQVLKKLKGEAREAIVLRYIEEHSIKEVAKILGKSEGAVRTMIHRAIKDIRGEIEKMVR